VSSESAIATPDQLRGTTHFYTLDEEFRFTSVSRTAATLWQRKPASLIGRNLWEEFPTAAQSEGYEHHVRAMRDREIRRYRVYSPQFQRWYHFTLCPGLPSGLMCFFREEFKAESSAPRPSSDPRRDSSP
jgi:hypothetical protein